MAALISPEGTLMISPELEKELEEKLQDVLPGVARPQMLRAIGVVENTIQIHSGPLPSPQQLAAYDEIMPGAAKEIFGMTIAEQKHRHSSDKRNASILTAGLLLGFFVSVMLISAAVYTAVQGQPWVAAAFVATSAVGMVPAFINGGRKNAASDTNQMIRSTD
jgi:uncharacterized membrane protein